jgi:hypothetical protein
MMFVPICEPVRLHLRTEREEKPQIAQMTQMTEGQDGSAGHDQELTRAAMDNAKRRQLSTDDRRLTRVPTKAKTSRRPQHHGNRYGRSEAARD